MMLKFVTSNPGKIAELGAMVRPLGHAVEQLRIDYPEVQSDTLEGVVDFALEWFEGKVEPPFLLEDSGLFIEPLGGFPGVYSKFAFTTVGNEGILRLMRGVEDGEGKAGRGAIFKCCIGYVDGDGGRHRVLGQCKGRIATEMRGKGGFGFDPIFIPEGRDRTYAEMEMDEKNALSHRGRAVAAFVELLK